MRHSLYLRTMLIALLILFFSCTLPVQAAEDVSREEIAGILQQCPDLYFGSGAGGWGSSLQIRQDGSFEGKYEYADYGAETKVRHAEFSGKFGKFRKISDFCYSMQLEELTYEEEPGNERVENGIRYIADTAYGIAGGKEFYLILPGMPFDELPTGFKYWCGIRGEFNKGTPKNYAWYGVYNVKDEYSFSGAPKEAHPLLYYTDDKDREPVKFDKSLESILLSTDSSVYNPELAYLLSILSAAAYDKALIARDMYSLGFPGVHLSTVYDVPLSQDLTAAFAAGRKTLSDGTTLIVIAVRGTHGDIAPKAWFDFSNVGPEWWGGYGDFMVIDPTDSGNAWHYGFKQSADSLYQELKGYLGSIETQKVKYVLTGHSRGAAMANMLSYYLMQDGVRKEDLYDYNFACPDVISTGFLNNEIETAYPNIFNLADCRDPVSLVPGVLGDMLFNTGTLKPGFDWSGFNERLGKVWRKFGNSWWFSWGWTNYSHTGYDIWAHEPANYIDFFSELNPLESFKNYADTTRIRYDNYSRQLQNKRPKLFGVFCPVDVELRDSAGNLLVSVTEEQITYGNEFGKAFAFVYESEKLIFLPEGGEVFVTLTGTDSGEMILFLAEGGPDRIEEETVKLSDPLPLEKGICYTGSIGSQGELTVQRQEEEPSSAAESETTQSETPKEPQETETVPAETETEDTQSEKESGKETRAAEERENETRENGETSQRNARFWTEVIVIAGLLLFAAILIIALIMTKEKRHRNRRKDS